MNDRLQFISADKLDGKFGVSLYCPTYRDYSLAMKMYPAESRENPNGPGYTFEEFLCSLCIRDANGKEPDNNPKDAIERFSVVDLKHKQYITRTFISAFLLTQELQDDAEAYADKLLDTDPNSLSYTIPADDLPWGSADFTFNRPTSSVQVSVTKNYTSPRINGCAWEEMFFATCLTHINGEPVQDSSNVIRLLYELEVLDIQYCAAVFIKMFSMGMNERKDAVDLGKSWRVKRSPQRQETKPKSASTKSANTSTT